MGGEKSISARGSRSMDTILGSTVVVISMVVAIALLKWAVKLLSWVWLRPRKMERYLREQGLNGSRYSPFLCDVRDCVGAMRAEQPRSLQLSDDILPHIYPFHLQKLSKYGENSFVWFGPWPLLNISDPEIVKEMMKKSEVIQRPYQGAVKILTTGLLTLEGPKWSHHRKIANPAFHLHKLKNMVPAICFSCSSIINKLEAEAMISMTNEVDMWPYLEDLSADIISRTAFGSNHEEGRKVFELQKEKLTFIPQVMQFAFIPKWRYVPTKVNRRTAAITGEIKSIIKGIIEKRKLSASSPSNDLLGMLLDSNEKEGGGGMSVGDVIDECEQFYLVGSETTSCMLVWAMVMLCKHPHWQTRAREEVSRVLGDSDPTFDSLNQLKTVTMILQEVLRMYPPVPIIVRRTTEKVRLGKWNIPAGVYLKVLIGLLHYDPKTWGDDAKEFNPERFAGGVKSQSSSFMPFAAGPHICIGQNFAMVEAKTAIAMLLRRFSFELSPSYSHAPFSLFTMSPQYGAPMILRTLS